mmetsp:Transcript_8664/g.28458  ORF Transcript_8664/g.28458 Transcript_8664/m.28458 type:complete len:270 (-) Transcript_8664:589-1398(-)
MRALGGCGGASGGVAGTGTSRVRNAGLLRTGQYPAGASTQPSAAAFAPNKALCRAILPPPPPPCPLTRGAGRRAPGTVALASSNGVDIGVEGYIQVSQESPPTREKYAREVGEMYGKRAAKYDHGDNGRWHTNTSLELVRAAGLKRGQVVLDVGTGTGITAFHAATFVGDSGHVLGVDISEGMLEVANAKLLAAGEAMRWVVTFRLGDCENPSYAKLQAPSSPSPFTCLAAALLTPRTPCASMSRRGDTRDQAECGYPDTPHPTQGPWG